MGGGGGLCDYSFVTSLVLGLGLGPGLDKNYHFSNLYMIHMLKSEIV